MINARVEILIVVDKVTHLVREGPIQLRVSARLWRGFYLEDPGRAFNDVTVLSKTFDLLNSWRILRYGPAVFTAPRLRFQVDRHALVLSQFGPIDEASPDRAESLFLSLGLTKNDVRDSPSILQREELEDGHNVVQSARMKRILTGRFHQEDDFSPKDLALPNDRFDESFVEDAILTPGLGDAKPIVRTVALLRSANVPIPPPRIKTTSHHDDPASPG